MIHPKPKPIRKPGVRVMPGGREVCGKAEYQRRRELIWDRDRGNCCLCDQFVPLDQATTEHLNGRGSGGHKRDDRLEVCGVAHWAGNNAKGSQSHEKYMALPLETRIKNCRGGI